jgi:Fanconi anemia group J protein
VSPVGRVRFPPSRPRLLDEHAAGTGKGCRFYGNIRSLSASPLFQIGVWDIEDLVAAGHKVGCLDHLAGLLTAQKHACPYYASRELLLDAEIVFCPYNYLLDPVIRRQMSISLKV